MTTTIRPSRTAADVAEFHRAFGLPAAGRPAVIPDHIADNRLELILEEVRELTDAIHNRDLIEIADGLGDVVYMAYGVALSYGIDLDAVLAEVHRSNMTKLDRGKPKFRADGKVVKPAGYERPNIAAVLGLPAA